MLRRPFLLLLSAFLALAAPAQAAIETSAEHGLLMDAQTGQVLWQKDGMTPMPPASMSKLMTIELLFSRLKDGRVKLTDTFPVSERAWRTQGSKMFVELGSRIPVESLLRGIIIQSGNDACVVVAEALGGTFEGFVNLMNKRAKELGLNQSTFVNPDGLPDPPGQLMSALDLAKLSRHIINTYPQLYHYFSEREFVWHNIHQPNRDLVLASLPGADGLKTGHTDAAGYGITISVKRGDQRLILVLNGLRYPQYHNDYFPNIRRAEEAARVMELAFREFRSYPVLTTNQVAGSVVIAGGVQPTVPVTECDHAGGFPCQHEDGGESLSGVEGAGPGRPESGRAGGDGAGIPGSDGAGLRHPGSQRSRLYRQGLEFRATPLEKVMPSRCEGQPK